MTTYQPFYATARAVLVGIDDYQNPQFSPLGRAEQDARDLAAVIAAPPYDFDVSMLLGADATRQAILDALYDAQEASSADDCLLVYFAGHGYTIPTQFGRETGFLACADTIPERHHTALRMDELTGTRDYNPAKHIAFILDACFSGAALGLTRTQSGPAEHYLTRRAYQVMSAGAPDQAVPDYYSMTSHLLSMLRDHQELLTLDGLAAELRDTITAESGGKQIPLHGHMTGSQGGAFVFYTPTVKEPVDLLPDSVRRGLRSDNVEVRFYAVDGAARLLADPVHGANARAALETLAVHDPESEVRAQAYAVLHSSMEISPRDATVVSDATQPVPAVDAPAPKVIEDEPLPPDLTPTVPVEAAARTLQPAQPLEVSPSPVTPRRGIPIWLWAVGRAGGRDRCRAGTVIARRPRSTWP